MARILICADDVAVESLLVVISQHLGHDPAPLGPAPVDELPAGDLLLVDPTAPRAPAWAGALRQRDPALPVVAIGLDPYDPDSLGFEPTQVVGKPFRLQELTDAIASTLRDD